MAYNYYTSTGTFYVDDSGKEYRVLGNNYAPTGRILSPGAVRVMGSDGMYYRTTQATNGPGNSKATKTDTGNTVASRRYVNTGSGKQNYWVVTDDKGNVTFQNEDGKNRTPITSDAQKFEAKWYQQTGRGLPGGIWDDIQNRTTNDEYFKTLSDALDAGVLTGKKGDEQLWIDTDSLFQKDASGNYKYIAVDDKGNVSKTDPLKKLINIGLVREDDFNTKASTFRTDFLDAQKEAKKNAPLVKTPEEMAIENQVFTAAGFAKDANGNWVVDMQKEQPTFAAPEFTPDYTQQWYRKLEEIDKPGDEAAMKAVQDQMNFLNPYGLGGGGQLKATNKLITDIVSNRQTRALALGQAAYDRDYAQKYAEYERKLGDIATAKSQAGNLAEYFRKAKNYDDEGTRADYLTSLNLENARLAADNERVLADRQYQRDQDMLARIEQLYKPREQNWWDPVVNSLASTAGYVAGNAVTNPLLNLFKVQKYLKPAQ